MLDDYRETDFCQDGIRYYEGYFIAEILKTEIHGVGSLQTEVYESQDPKQYGLFWVNNGKTDLIRLSKLRYALIGIMKADINKNVVEDYRKEYHERIVSRKFNTKTVEEFIALSELRNTDCDRAENQGVDCEKE
jgi:hypothetical protein